MKHLSLSTAVFFLVGLISPLYSFAGKIYLKDGSIETSRSIWETDQFVHFILHGTDSVEVRFSKAIVSKIEYDDGTIQDLDGAGKTIEPQQEKSAPSLSIGPVGPPEAAHSKNAYISEAEKKKIIRANRGHQFYDPRRKKRFWARHDARFETLGQAMEALSAVYNRPVSWVEKYMGEENDLAVIHRNLIRQMEREIAGSGKVQQTEADPRDKTTAFPPQPGKTKNVKANAPTSVSEPALEDRPQDPDSVNGLKFYNPRRPYKYWSSADDHHQTLDDAIDALSKHYHVSPQWIESHMGAGNDLEAIHRNIQQSLKRE